MDTTGEPLLRPYTGTSKYSNGRTASPTFDMNTSLAGRSPVKDEATVQAMMLNENGHGGLTPFMNMESRLSTVYSKSQEPLIFPTSESNAGVYSFELLKILQRWFRCNGWPNAQNLVKIPESFRAGVSKKPLDEGQDSMPQQDAIKRENKTIYEMIAYLSGRQLPAIPVGAPVPHDLKDRTFQFNWQHKVFSI